MKKIAIILVLLGSLLIMANGKIRYTPFPSRAINMTGIYYLLLDEPENLLYTNPGFETGTPTGWTFSPNSGLVGDLAVTSGNSYAGTYKGQNSIDMAGTFDYWLESNDTLNLIRGWRYKILFAHKATEAATINIEIYDQYRRLIASSAAINTSASWTLSAFNFTSLDNFNGAAVAIHIEGEFAATGYIYVDNFTLCPEYLDMGSDSFSIDLLHQPLTDTGMKIIARKCDDNLTRGYALSYSHTTNMYTLFLGDGTNTAEISSAAMDQIVNQEWHWLRLIVDRTADLVSFFVNGVAKGTGSIAAVTGNVSAVEELRLFGWDGSNNLAVGFCDFIRFQRGTPMPAVWMAAEWARIQRGRIRGASDNAALWDFTDSLEAAATGLTLATSDSGTPAYAAGWPYCVSPLTYTFALNYTFDLDISPLEADSLVRACKTGAAYLSPGPRKNAYRVPFEGIFEDQYSALMAAYEGGESLDFWLDADQEQTACVCFEPGSPPAKNPRNRWLRGTLTYDLECNWVEV